MSYQYVPWGSGPAKTPLVNRRATVRYQCAPATPGRVIVAGDHEFQRAWVLDISTKGVGLLMSRSFDPGVLVTIHLKGIKKTFELSARVVHSTPQSSGDWVVGCALFTPLCQDDLDDVL